MYLPEAVSAHASQLLVFGRQPVVWMLAPPRWAELRSVTCADCPDAGGYCRCNHWESCHLC